MLPCWSGKVHSEFCQSLNPLRHQIPSQRVIGDREQCWTMEDDNQRRGTSLILTLSAKKDNLACLSPKAAQSRKLLQAIFGIQRASSPLSELCHDEGQTHRTCG